MPRMPGMEEAKVNGIVNAVDPKKRAACRGFRWWRTLSPNMRAGHGGKG